MLRRVFLQSQLLAIFTTLLGTWTASAQSTDLPLWKTGILGPPIRIDRTEPVSVHANLVTHDATSQRITLQGDVQLSCKGYELVADKVIYDQTLDKLIAEGNARLRDPYSAIANAERIELPSELGLGGALLETLWRADFQVAPQ